MTLARVADACACVRPGAPVCDECPEFECAGCGLPPEHCDCDAPCDLCGNEHERGEPCFDDDSCECGTWPCTCNLYGYDDFSEDWENDWRDDLAAAAEYDDAYWRDELRYQSRRGLCGVCDVHHDERTCDLWRSGDVPAVRAMLGEPAYTCPDCGRDEGACHCEGEPIDTEIVEPARPRPWEVLRSQLEAIGFGQFRAAREGRA